MSNGSSSRRRQMQRSIRSLISYGKTIGLPTMMLEKVYLGGYKVAFHSEASGAYTGVDTITFPRNIVKSLGSIAIDGIHKEAKAVGLLFHEGTHALIDINLRSGDREFHSLHARAKRHYTEAKFVDGSRVPRAELDTAVTEAAAWYVHENVYVWWMAREIMEDLSQSGLVRDGSVTLPIPSHVASDILSIANYARHANYGISPFDDKTDKRLAKAIHPGLKSFCDDVVLEGKIKLSLANYLNALVGDYA